MRFRMCLKIPASLLTMFALSFSTTVTYQEDITNFPNPERGFYSVRLESSRLKEARTSGMTLVRKYYELGSWVNSDVLSKSIHDQIDSDAAVLRQTGSKMIPRFRYNTGNCTDAPLQRILLHIEQLGPTLRANSDVIAFLETGFIGRWGEWHHDGCTDVNKLGNTAARSAILKKLLSVVPDRMVNLRYNFHKRDIFGPNPLDPNSAFRGSDQARTGAQNDCYLYDQGDRGTYQGSMTVEQQKNYLNQDNRYVPQDGESCGGSSTYYNCTKALEDFKRMHWDAINSSFESSVLNNWKSNGCYGTIEKLLGYRLKMESAHLIDAVRPGYAFSGTINLTNIGWGKIYNVRGCELVFRNTTSKNEFTLKLSNDPRQWCMTDSMNVVKITAIIPAATIPGSYAVYLHLPDTASRLYGKPAFSIRLANSGVWEESTGYNSLKHNVSISNDAPITSTFQYDAHGLPSNFSVSTVKKNNTYTFSIQSPDGSAMSIELFTQNGKRLARHQIYRGANNKFSLSWHSPSTSCYILKIRQGEHFNKAYTVF